MHDLRLPHSFNFLKPDRFFFMQPRIKVIDSDRKTNGSNKSKKLFYKKTGQTNCCQLHFGTLQLLKSFLECNLYQND